MNWYVHERKLKIWWSLDICLFSKRGNKFGKEYIGYGQKLKTGTTTDTRYIFYGGFVWHNYSFSTDVKMIIFREEAKIGPGENPKSN